MSRGGGHVERDQTVRPTLFGMKLPWRRERIPSPGVDDLGLDSIRFDTLGLVRQPDAAANHRYWLGTTLGLGEYWFPGSPEPLTLDEDEIRATYEGLLAEPANADGLTPLVVQITVHRETPVPVVCALIRLPDDHRYTFVGAITVLLAECSWVIKVQSSEGPVTGLREAAAFDRFLEEHPMPRASVEGLASHFDPYEAHWDSDHSDPLTLVRQSANKVLASLEVDPEVRRRTPFPGTPGPSAGPMT